MGLGDLTCCRVVTEKRTSPVAYQVGFLSELFLSRDTADVKSKVAQFYV